MTNTITIKKEILFLEGKINNITMKDGSEIQYVSVAAIIKSDNCKVDCSFKVKPEEYLALELRPYESYEAILQLDIQDKVKIRILEIK